MSDGQLVFIQGSDAISLDAITSVSTNAVPAQQYDGRYHATM